MDDQTKILDFLKKNNISVESVIEKLNNVNNNNTVYSKAADEIINDPDFNIDMVEKIMIDLDWPAHIITKKKLQTVLQCLLMMR